MCMYYDKISNRNHELMIFKKWLQIGGGGGDYVLHTYGVFIKDEYYSWVQYKSGPGGRPSM